MHAGPPWLWVSTEKQPRTIFIWFDGDRTRKLDKYPNCYITRFEKRLVSKAFQVDVCVRQNIYLLCFFGSVWYTKKSKRLRSFNLEAFIKSNIRMTFWRGKGVRGDLEYSAVNLFILMMRKKKRYRNNRVSVCLFNRVIKQVDNL